MPAKKAKSKSDSQVILLVIILVLALAAFLIYLALGPMKRDKYFEGPIPLTTHQVAGIYKGKLPCADCPGINETLALTASNSAQTNGSFVMEDIYLEKNTAPFQTVGSWQVLQNNILELNPSITYPQPSYFQIQQNGNLLMLDQNMQKIDSPFNETLIKQ